MRVATGPGKVLEKGDASPKVKGRYALLYNFDIDDSQIKPEHQDWLLKNVVPLLTRARTFTVALKGTASRSGSASYNMQLSQRRVETFETFLKQNGVLSQQLSRTWVGESEAASFGRLDGSESEEDRAVAVFISGPELEVPKFVRRHWWNHCDGFDPFPKMPWKMVPAYDWTPVRLVNGAGWKLRSSKPGTVYIIDPDTNRRTDELIIRSNDVVFRLGGLIPGSAQILAEDVFGAVRPLLDTSVLEAKTVRVAFHFVEDKAKHKTKRAPGEERAMLGVVNRAFKPQANLTFESVHSKALTAKEDWGNPVTYKEMGGEFLPLLRNYRHPTARINVFFVWDYQPDNDGDADAEVDNIGGSGVIFEDRAGRDVGLSMAHEFGHNLGLPHRDTRKELVMWPSTDERGGVLEKDQILTAHAKV